MPLVTANQFDLVPDIGSLGQDFQRGQQIRRNLDAKSRQSQLGGLSTQALGGESAALGQIAAIDPQRAQQIQVFMQGKSDAERNEILRENEVLTRIALNAASLKSPDDMRSFLRGESARLKSEGRDTSNIDAALQGDDAQMSQAITLQAREGQTTQQLAEQLFPSNEFKLKREALDFKKSQASAKQKADIEAEQIRLLEEEVKASKTKFDQAAKIRAEVQKVSGEFVKVESAFDRINSSQNTGPGDLSLIFNFMRMLDPASVVREAEFALAENAAGIPDRLINIVNKLSRGERLTKRQRASFKSQAGDLFNTARSSQERRLNDFVKLGKRFNLERGDIIVSEVPSVDGDLNTEEAEELKRLEAKHGNP